MPSYAGPLSCATVQGDGQEAIRHAGSSIGAFTDFPGCPETMIAPLLVWYRREARDLPWRRTRDPYAIWISEIMLQQTQVRTVIPYWERWMRALPNVQALAAAPAARVLKLWEGLGYYTRARNLQAAARQIQEQHAGRFPRTFAAVLALPGIGRYTAGAICSIAFNQPTPILDGNLMRVLSRVFCLREPPREPRANARLWHLAECLVQTAGRRLDGRACSDLNQALMELGAVMCTPRQPRCPACPLRAHCLALRRGCAPQLPTPAERPPVTRRHAVAFVVQHAGRFLVQQRPAGRVNAQLWEFPSLETDAPAKPRSAALLAQRRLGLRLQSLQPFCALQHSITRYRIRLAVMRAEVDQTGAAAAGALPRRWVSAAQLARLPLTGAHCRIRARLREEHA